jgi:tetraacyldisaccharide 4'-kinase
MSWATRHLSLQPILSRIWSHRGPLAWLLSPVALLYGALVKLRRYLYRSGYFKIQRVPVPVIVVGNVVAGGSGKTPVVMTLVRHLQSRGLRVGVVSRGYGRRARDCREVLPTSAISDVGDEPALIQRITSANVFVAPRRFDAANRLLLRYPDTQVIVCDDGLQHVGLYRDLEICVFDDRGVGNGYLLPAGLLREPWPRNVDLVLHTGANPAFAGFTAQRSLAALARRADGSEIALEDLTHSHEKPLLAVAAIAKPEDFFAMLRAQGLRLTRTIALPDHYDFADWPIDEYAGYTIICTQKDAVKLWQRRVNALAVPLLFMPDPAFMAQLDWLLSGLLASQLNAKLSSAHGHKTS